MTVFDCTTAAAAACCSDASIADIPLDHASASRSHAALCHHNDGRLFLIDLASSGGTRVDGAQVPPNKPTLLRNGSAVAFADCPIQFTLRDVESTGEEDMVGAVCCVAEWVWVE